MTGKQRFFIYDHREMWILILLGLMVALFAFTLGVHLGKRVATKPGAPEAHTQGVQTTDDHVPGRVELSEQARGVEEHVDSALSENLHDEVTRTGIKTETPRQVELPKKTASPHAGSTTLSKEEAEIPASKRTEPKGEYTLQVGSYPKLTDAKDHLAALESLGIQPFLRSAEVKGSKWYRIYLGGYPSVKEAERVGNRYQKQHVIESFIVAKMPSAVP